MNVGDRVEVCDRPVFRAGRPEDPVIWRSTIARATKTLWFVADAAGRLWRFSKETGLQLDVVGAVRYLRARKTVPLVCGSCSGLEKKHHARTDADQWPAGGVRCLNVNWRS